MEARAVGVRGKEVTTWDVVVNLVLAGAVVVGAWVVQRPRGQADTVYVRSVGISSHTWLGSLAWS